MSLPLERLVHLLPNIEGSRTTGPVVIRLLTNLEKNIARWFQIDQLNWLAHQLVNHIVLWSLVDINWDDYTRYDVVIKLAIKLLHLHFPQLWEVLKDNLYSRTLAKIALVPSFTNHLATLPIFLFLFFLFKLLDGHLLLCEIICHSWLAFLWLAVTFRLLWIVFLVIVILFLSYHGIREALILLENGRTSHRCCCCASKHCHHSVLWKHFLKLLYK